MSVKNEAVATKVTDASSLTGFDDTPVQIVHSCKGHLRIRILRLAYDATYASRLKSLAESLNFVTKVRLNPAASSLVVEYDSNKVATSDTVQKQVFTAIEQATHRDISQSKQKSPPATAEESTSSRQRHFQARGASGGATLNSPNVSQKAAGSEASSAIELAETEISHSGATDLAQENSASRAESKNSHTLKGKTPQEYALLVRGNYSVSSRLNLGEGSSL